MLRDGQRDRLGGIGEANIGPLRLRAGNANSLLI
jgi:hypothetical protein